MEKVSDKDPVNIRQNIVPNINWCSDANDWGEGDDIYGSDADNCNEQNGNIIKNDNRSVLMINYVGKWFHLY